MYRAERNDEVVDALQGRNAPGVELTVSRTIPEFMDGELVIVDVAQNGVKTAENFYYKSRFGRSRTFVTMDELALWMSQQGIGTRRESGLARLTGSASVAAIIAVLIATTICFVVIWQLQYGAAREIVVPDILANALTTILGFYFGREVVKARREGVATASSSSDRV